MDPGRLGLESDTLVSDAFSFDQGKFPRVTQTEGMKRQILVPDVKSSKTYTVRGMDSSRGRNCSHFLELPVASITTPVLQTMMELLYTDNNGNAHGRDIASPTESIRIVLQDLRAALA